jgi:hypothetical protein
LTFLTTLSSVVFAVGAIAGWTLGLWPATPVTLLAAASVVLGGPLLSLVLARRIGRPAHAAPAAPAPPVRMQVARAPAPAPRPVALPLTPEQAWGQQLLDWRDRPWRRRR